LAEDVNASRYCGKICTEKFLVSPLETIQPIDERYLADALESIPLVKEDNIALPYCGGKLKFEVIAMTPPIKKIRTQRDRKPKEAMGLSHFR